MSKSLGQIVLLQIHTESLKRGDVYDPSSLLAVERGSIDGSGMLGWNGTGWAVDIHHEAHPRAKGGGHKALSIGFVAHYERMAERFGDAPLGVAGENIIVDGPAVSAQDVAAGLVVRTQDGAVFEFRSPMPALACPGFTSHLLRSATVLPRDEITEHLAFLSTGTRGFILSVDHIDRPVEVSVGDEVFTR
ncbi:MAG: hypothetical protein U9N79_01585 [Actinomycetota bacterium]|nr:hypothetical protein [Actinomycetota bacterium]